MNGIGDFANSYLTFELRGTNTARIRIDARCEWTDTATGETEEFVLICPCQGERMYRTEDLLQDPPYNFLGVFSRTQSHLIRHHADAGVNADTVEDHKGRFDRVTLDIATFAPAVELPGAKEVVAATLANRPLIARTEMRSADGRSRALLEYPVTTMNVEPDQPRWQVDTGPVLFADFDRPVERRIEKMVPGFIVYNTLTYAEWTLRAPVRLAAGGSVHHFGEMRRGPAASRLYSVPAA